MTVKTINIKRTRKMSIIIMRNSDVVSGGGFGEGGASVVICAYMRIIRACMRALPLARCRIFSQFLSKIVRHQPGHSTDNERACI